MLGLWAVLLPILYEGVSKEPSVKFLLFIAYLARSPFHGLGLGNCDFLDASATFVQTSAVAVGMVALGLWAGTDIHHAALQRFKSLEAVQFRYATCNVLRTFKWCKWHTRKNYC